MVSIIAGCLLDHASGEVIGEEPGLSRGASLELPSDPRFDRPARTPARLVRRDDAPAFHDLVRDKFDLPGTVGGAV
jgi:hypothetical protein